MNRSRRLVALSASRLILPDWFLLGAVLDDALVLTIDRAWHLDSTGGLGTLALPRRARKHGGRQSFPGWSFDFAHLHQKSGHLSPLREHFAYDLRDIIRRQPPARRPARHHAAGRQFRTPPPSSKTDPTFSPRRARGDFWNLMSPAL